MKIAVIGTGNSGCAQAAKLVENGHEVRLIKTSAVNGDNFSAIMELKGVYYRNQYIKETDYHFAPLAHVTKDVKQGIEGADVVLILTQSLQHADIAKLVGPYLEDNQIVILIPGNLGSIQFKLATSKQVIFAECESTPYDARIVEPGKVDILFRNVRNAVAFLEQKHRTSLSTINKLFDAHKFLRTNVIESAMHNPNLVVHTIGTIMSASRIEKMKGEFWMYRESFSPSIWNLVAQLDQEKNAVIVAYGGKPISYLDACKWRNEEDLSVDSKQVFEQYAMDGGPKGPNSLNNRFITEDVPMGLGQLELLAIKKGIETPVASSLITLASSLTNKDYRQITKQLSSITNLTADDINDIALK